MELFHSGQHVVWSKVICFLHLATEVPNQLFAQLCSQVSPMPERAKDTTWRWEKTKAEQGHQHGSPELSRSGEVDTVALVIRTGGTREAGEAAELALHSWKRGLPGRKEWGRTRSRAGWEETPQERETIGEGKRKQQRGAQFGIGEIRTAWEAQ